MNKSESQPMTPQIKPSDETATGFGPCVICGAMNYSLSCGGPTICPKCDAGQFDQATVYSQTQYIKRLRAEIERFSTLPQGREAALEEAAQVADRDAQQAQRQIDENYEYMKRTGSDDESCNNLCRHRKHYSQSIATAIRALKSATPQVEQRDLTADEERCLQQAMFDSTEPVEQRKEGEANTPRQPDANSRSKGDDNTQPPSVMAVAKPDDMSRCRSWAGTCNPPLCETCAAQPTERDGSGLSEEDLSVIKPFAELARAAFPVSSNKKREARYQHTMIYSFRDSRTDTDYMVTIPQLRALAELYDRLTGGKP